MLNISEEKKIEILYDHYKESFLCVKYFEKQRERLLAFLLMIVFFQFLLAFFSGESLDAFNAVIEKQIGFSFVLNEAVFSILFWFLLFSASLRYFQTNVLISRQYEYIHKLENDICKKVDDEDFIIREQLGYKREHKGDHPIFTNWVRIVYTWIFPILLISISFLRISLEKYSFDILAIGILAIKFVLFLAICTTTVFYLEKIHGKNPKSDFNSNKSK